MFRSAPTPSVGAINSGSAVLGEFIPKRKLRPARPGSESTGNGLAESAFEDTCDGLAETKFLCPDLPAIALINQVAVFGLN